MIVVGGQALAAERPSVVGAAGVSAAAGVSLNAFGGLFTTQTARLRTAGDRLTAMMPTAHRRSRIERG
jgi:hypothetical protein